MLQALSHPTGPGPLLASWRSERRLSQLELSLRAGVSTKHLSFVETGRSSPSRPMVLALCEALDVPLRERNTILLAAGYAPQYRETPLSAPEMAEAVQALSLVLAAHEPFGALAFDRTWNVVMANAAYIRWSPDLFPKNLPALELLPTPRPNLLRMLFAEGGYRERLANWPAVAAAVLARVRRELSGDGDPKRRAEIVEALGFDLDAQHRFPKTSPERPLPLILPIELLIDGTTVRLFNTIATLGTSVDITLRELRIEMFHPADPESDRWVRERPASAG